MSRSIESVKGTDQEKRNRVDDKPVVAANAHAAVFKQQAHQLNNKERLSAYFTIAAAAFGLVSDGCPSPLILLSVYS
jgi:hypothetical protein